MGVGPQVVSGCGSKKSSWLASGLGATSVFAWRWLAGADESLVIGGCPSPRTGPGAVISGQLGTDQVLQCPGGVAHGARCQGRPRADRIDHRFLATLSPWRMPWSYRSATKHPGFLNGQQSWNLLT